MKYFISDLHLSKSGINKVSCVDSQLHNQFVSTMWNTVITDDDEVYIVGGVGDLSLLSTLNGNKVILLGKSDLDRFNQYVSSEMQFLIKKCIKHTARMNLMFKYSLGIH